MFQKFFYKFDDFLAVNTPAPQSAPASSNIPIGSSNSVFGNTFPSGSSITSGPVLTGNSQLNIASSPLSNSSSNQFYFSKNPFSSNKAEPFLPVRVFECLDENNRSIKLILDPERSMTAFESFQLTRLLLCNPHQIDILTFVRTNNLEKHFKFQQ